MGWEVEMTDGKTSSDLPRDDAALDALLRQAKPQRDEGREAALLARIMATAEKTPRLVVATPAVVAPAAARSLALRRPDRDIWRAAGIMAAALVVGVFLGQSSFGEQTARRIEQSTGFMLASAGNEAAYSLAALEADDDE
jgi:hypothetical protein